MKKNLFFAALFLAALAFGFVGCENPDSESGISMEKPGDDSTSDKPTDSDADGSDQNGNTKPTTPEEPMLVATGGATDVEYSSVTLWGRLNTDTLVFFPKVKWGVEYSASKEEITTHSGKKKLCTADLVGENADEFSVELTEVGYGKMLYYNAYLLINDIKYVYGEVDSVHMDVKLTLKPNNSDYGTVTGSGTYDHLAEVTITATLKENYYFAGWSDCDSKELTRTVQVNSDTTITANFSLNPCLTVQANNSNYGTVTGSGLYEKGTEATITATPEANCYFTSWSDGNTENLRTVVVNSDTTFTANFAKKPYLTVNTNNTSYGTVTGSGYYMPGDEVTITATPKANYYFTSWSDGNTENLRTVVVNSDTTFTANFAKKPYLTVKSNYTSYGTVTGSGYYMPGDEVSITATPKAKCYFNSWRDGVADNPRTVVVNSDITFTANFAKKPYLTVNVNSDTEWGEVSGSSGYYMPGDEVTITATPNKGAYFVKWNDGNTDNPRTVTINENITYTATFAGNPNGTENGYEWVDLALPSGLKWATCNVGATKPEEYGDYYAWGETTPKTYYYWDTYKLCKGSYNTMAKYCTDSYYGILGTVDNKTVLDPEDDAAAVNMGGSWRMPTYEEQDELRTECTWTWTTLNGVKGYNVEGPNGNSIFLPAAGYRSLSDLYSAGSLGNYWSSSLSTGSSDDACSLSFSSDRVNWSGSYRYYGHSVRGVCP